VEEEEDVRRLCLTSGMQPLLGTDIDKGHSAVTRSIWPVLFDRIVGTPDERASIATKFVPPSHLRFGQHSQGLFVYSAKTLINRLQAPARENLLAWK
jgi:hypothetical protein